MTLDLPTPPLPEATAITVVSEPAKKVGCCCGPRRRAGSIPAKRCSSLIGERETSTRSTPSIGASASVTSLVIRSLSGQALDRDQDVDANQAAIQDLDVPEHADVLDRPADLGVHDRPQRFSNPVLRDHAMTSSIPAAITGHAELGSRFGSAGLGLS